MPSSSTRPPGPFDRSRGAAMRRVAALAVPLLLAALGGPRPLRAQEDALAPGTKPDTPVLEDLAGEPVDLARWVGKEPVLVEFWATWCPICRALEPRVEAAHDRFGDRVRFLQVAVGVSETPASVRKFLERHPQPGHVLWDGEGRATRAFRAPGTSYVVILDRHGRVVYTGIGARQNLEAALAEAVR